MRTRIPWDRFFRDREGETRFRKVVLTLLLGLAPLAAAGQQAAIFADFPCGPTNPEPCFLERANAGQQIGLAVSVGEGFGGTASFSSSDPLAELPGPVTFDPSVAGGDFLVVFHTLGTQSITVTDLSGRLSAGTATILIVSDVSIPDLSATARVVFGALLGVAGIWLLRDRLA